MCAACHGAPGKERGEIGKGLNPSPPNLAEVASSWSSAELFWILKNGIKMTGMPAFGPTHSDARLWSIVAFVMQLPKLTPDDYKKMGHPASKHEHQEEDRHDHQHQ
jgi:mono/diheme cytochrome c family protein